MPSTQAAPAADDAALRTLVAELDQYFNRGDAAGYLAAFAPDHQPAHARYGDELRQRLGAGWQRRSLPIEAPRTANQRHWVRLRHDYFTSSPKPSPDATAKTTANTAAAAQAPVLTEWSLLAFAVAADGRCQPRFAVLLADEQALPAGQLWRCRACNYEIGGVEGWICVPEARCKAQALEAVTFYRLGTDLSCEVSVRAEECPRNGTGPDAMQLAQAVADELIRQDAGARQQVVLPWQPASLPANVPHCSAAKVRVEHAGGQQVCVVHLVAFGRLQHLLLLRGSSSSFREQAEAVRLLCDSFRILEPTRPAAAACAEALQHHTGGGFEGNEADGVRYANQAFGLALQGPAGFVAARRCGGALIRVVWEEPGGGRLWLHGYAVPPGLDHWCPKTAVLWLQRLAAASGLEAPAELPAFQPCGTSNHPACQWACSQKSAVPGLPGRNRWLKVMLRPDLLVVVDAAPANRQQEAALQAALDSLQLR